MFLKSLHKVGECARLGGILSVSNAIPSFLKISRTQVDQLSSSETVVLLTFNYVPESWRRARYIFIPKFGRRGPEVRSAQRNVLYKYQNVYCRCMSVDTALDEVMISTVESSIHN